MSKPMHSCDVSDALCKLQFPNGGFLSGLTMWSPKRQEGNTKIVGPAYTVKYVPLSDPSPKHPTHYVSLPRPAGLPPNTYIGLCTDWGADRLNSRRGRCIYLMPTEDAECRLWWPDVGPGSGKQGRRIRCRWAIPRSTGAARSELPGKPFPVPFPARFYGIRGLSTTTYLVPTGLCSGRWHGPASPTRQGGWRQCARQAAERRARHYNSPRRLPHWGLEWGRSAS